MKTLWITTLVWTAAALPGQAQRPTVDVEFCVTVGPWMKGDAREVRDVIVAGITHGTSTTKGLAGILTMLDFEPRGGAPADFLLHIVLEPSGETSDTSTIETRFGITFVPLAGDTGPWTLVQRETWQPGDIRARLGLTEEGDPECRASVAIETLQFPIKGTYAPLRFDLAPGVQFAGVYSDPSQFADLVRTKFLAEAQAKRPELVPKLLGSLSWGAEAFALVDEGSANLVMPFSWEELGAVGRSTELSGEPSVLRVVMRNPKARNDLTYYMVESASALPWEELQEYVAPEFLAAHESVAPKVVAEETKVGTEPAPPSLATTLGIGDKPLELRGIFIHKHFPNFAPSGQWNGQ